MVLAPKKAGCSFQVRSRGIAGAGPDQQPVYRLLRNFSQVQNSPHITAPSHFSTQAMLHLNGKMKSRSRQCSLILTRNGFPSLFSETQYA